MMKITALISFIIRYDKDGTNKILMDPVVIGC